MNLSCVCIDEPRSLLYSAMFLFAADQPVVFLESPTLPSITSKIPRFFPLAPLYAVMAAVIAEIKVGNEPSLSVIAVSISRIAVPPSTTPLINPEFTNDAESFSNTAWNCATLPLIESRYFSFSFSAEPAEFIATSRTASASAKLFSSDATALLFLLPPIISRMLALVISVRSSQTLESSFKI